MKRLIFALILASSMTLLGEGAAVRAANLDGIGRWEGTGTVLDPDGRELTTFTVELVRTAKDDHTIQSRGKLTLADGKVVPLESTTVVEGAILRYQSNRGKGLGQCSAPGLCQIFEDAGKGHAFTTVLTADGANQSRILVTEIEDGAVVRFYRQALTRKR